MQARTFSYTAKRGAYLSVVGTFGFLFLTESSIFVLLIGAFVHNNILKFGLLAVYACLLLYIFFRLLSPLWTRHSLTSTYLSLRYGYNFTASIPRADISSAQAVRERLTLFEPISARYNTEKHRIEAAFSEHGQILIQLTQAFPFKVGGMTHLSESVLINIDQRNTFLTALQLAEQSVSKKEDDPMPIQQAKPTSLLTLLAEHKSDGKTLPAHSHAICIEGLTRKFGEFTAVNNLSMTIQPGEIYGFLGSNGAGKTTTIKMLVGLLEPNAGHARVLGHDMWTEPLLAKTYLGYVADRAILYERLTGREFLQFLAQIRKLPQSDTKQRIAYLLDLLDLTQQSDSLCGAYSFGMKRKLAIAGALLHQPPVLILDEPLNGLDPRSARRLKDLFTQLAINGTTILLSTHDLASAEAVCQRIGIIHKGRLLAEGSASELRERAAASDLESVFLNLTAKEVQR